MKCHNFFSEIRKDIAKCVICCTPDWRFKGKHGNKGNKDLSRLLRIKQYDLGPYFCNKCLLLVAYIANIADSHHTTYPSEEADGTCCFMAGAIRKKRSS